MPARVLSRVLSCSVMCAAALALTLLTMAVPVGAQTVTGTINGTVVDTTQAALPGVSIVIKNIETGVSQDYVTNERGFFNAPFLPLGKYEVTATLTGFGPVTRRDVEVTLNFTNVINFKLDPQITTEVVVTAEKPPINKVSGEVKQSMSAEQILEKPTFQNLNPTNTFLTLAETFAGFNENPMSGQNNPTASSGSSVNFNGTGTRGTTFQIDGVNNDDSSENQNRQGVNVASIKEFQIISNAYSAEFGRGSGAVVLVQTKSGTNRLHGEGSYTRQDSDWDSRQFFATTKPVNHRDNYSGVAGFPLVQNKLFAFVTAEYGERSGDSNYTRDIFTEAEKALPRLTRGNDTPANRQFIESVLARFGTLAPNDARSPRTYSGLVGFSQPVQDFSGKLDWEVRRDDRMNIRYQYSRQKFDNEDVIIGEATQQNNRQANLGVTWTRTWTSRIVGEFRYGLGMRDTNVNIKEGNDTPIIRFVGSPVSGSIIGNAGTFPITRDQVDNQFVYNVSALFGADHNFKVGTDIRFQQLDDLAQSFQRGFWNFNANCGGVLYSSSYAAFLDGCIASYQTAYGPFYLENSIGESNVYAEDNWRIKPNLTLNLGVRYELAGAAHEDEDRIDYRYSDDTNNIEPRLGVAWAPEWTDGWLGRIAGQPGEFSIRAGYGLYHGRIFQSVFSQGGASVRTNPPNATALSIGNVLPNVLNVSDPTLGYVFVPGPQTARHAETWPDDGLEMPSSHQWNLTIERAMPWQSTFRVSYTGTNGVGLLRYRNENLAVTPAEGGIVVVNHPNNAPAAGAPDLRGVKIDKVASDWLCAGTGFIPGVAVSATCPNPVPIANNEISLRVPRTNERRPDPQFTTNAIISNESESWYNALQLEWVKRVSSGIRFEANYTWSKATDYGSEFVATGGDSNSLGPDPKYYKGLSRFHTPHRFTFNWSWALPFFAGQRDMVGSILGGWQLTGVWKLAHGTPFTVIDSAGGDLNWDGFSENRPVILDPSLLGSTINDVDNSSTEQLPRAAFRRATPDDYGKDLVGRNTFYGDYVNNVDLALLKSFRMPVGRIMVRLEAFNAFNRVRFNLPSNDFNATTFGRVTGQLNTSRQIQFGLRYIF